jgi:uncharacterized protein (DUF488 family)
VTSRGIQVPEAASETSEPAITVWTIGHSNHSADRLLDLLGRAAIDVVIDVRSSPFSRYSPQFNRDQIHRVLELAGIRYGFMGAVLGGRPRDPAMYDADGHVRYDRVAATDVYTDAVDRVRSGAVTHRIAVLCGEEDPISCHRRRLIGRSLAEAGVSLLHIRGNGTIEGEESVAARDVEEHPDRFQLTLLDEPAWRSIHPVRLAPVGRPRADREEEWVPEDED